MNNNNNRNQPDRQAGTNSSPPLPLSKQHSGSEGAICSNCAEQCALNSTPTTHQCESVSSSSSSSVCSVICSPNATNFKKSEIPVNSGNSSSAVSSYSPSSSAKFVRSVSSISPTSPLSECAESDRHQLRYNSEYFEGERSRRLKSGSCNDLNGFSHLRLDSININGSGDNNNSASSSSPNAKRPPTLKSLAKKSPTALRPFSMSMDSRTNAEFKDVGKDPTGAYLTPLQRKDKEMKDIKKEITRLSLELHHRDERIFSLQMQVEDQAREFREELNRKNERLHDVMEEREKIGEEARLEKIRMEEDLARMATLYTELKVKQSIQEDQFQERYLDMYKRGQKAAMFERDQELEMLASSKQPKVTVKELTRKLSVTESELAKWQSLRLDETYKSAGKPVTDADVTLSFLKDSFFHFICDGNDTLRHFRAIVEIFRYSDEQMATIRKAVAESKEFNKLFKKEIG